MDDKALTNLLEKMKDTSKDDESEEEVGFELKVRLRCGAGLGSTVPVYLNSTPGL